MHLKYLFIISYFFIFIHLTKQDDSVISFNPSSISIVIGENQTVNIRILKLNLTYPILISFLYDDNFNNTAGYIETISNLIFPNSTSGEQGQTISIIGRHEGHLVLTAQSSQINISTIEDYLLIDIARSQVLNILIQIVGWIYFAAWSISFYPQIILNFRRRSVLGLNFDFLALNILGHSCYSIFNLSLYISTNIQQQYYATHPHGVLPVLLNDVVFSCHAVFACLVTIIQCLFFERSNQRVSYVARVIAGVFIVFLFVSSIVSLSNHLKTLTLLYFFSYVKLAITIIKYCPQAFMNYRRKSTEGWSIGNILLDFTGGVLSLLQMFFLARNYHDWSSIFGSPTKLGLGLFSILFDLLFIVQHYCLYRTHDDRDKFREINGNRLPSNYEDKSLENDIINETTPMFDRRP